jgi:PKD repeat protein
MLFRDAGHRREPDMSSDATGSSKKSSRVQAVVLSFLGMFSGATMMYLSPLVDRVVKPAKPIANFAVEPNGLTVAFHNRSMGGCEGWWDFGDGSPLEPWTLQSETITHAYPAPGTYVAKLTLRNLIGEENERSVNLQLESARVESPAIVSLEAIPVTPGGYAPATFRLVSKARNARLCVWDFGDDRPLHFSTESPNEQDRLVTFSRPGGYLVKLAAVNGERAVEKSTIVYVDEPPVGVLTAIVHVEDQGTRLTRSELTVPLTVSFPPQLKENVHRFERHVAANQGFEIVAARLEPVQDKSLRELQLKVARDRHSVQVSGELVREGGLAARGKNPPAALMRVVLEQEQRGPTGKPEVLVTATVRPPGSAVLQLPPFPEDWIEPRRQLRLELREGDRVIWNDVRLPRNVPVQAAGRKLNLLAAPVGDTHLRVELNDATAFVPRSPNAN